MTRWTLRGQVEYTTRGFSCAADSCLPSRVVAAKSESSGPGRCREHRSCFARNQFYGGGETLATSAESHLDLSQLAGMEVLQWNDRAIAQNLRLLRYDENVATLVAAQREGAGRRIDRVDLSVEDEQLVRRRRSARLMERQECREKEDDNCGPGGTAHGGDATLSGQLITTAENRRFRLETSGGRLERCTALRIVRHAQGRHGIARKTGSN